VSESAGAAGPITSLQNPRVKSAVRLRDRRDRDRDRRFLIEGYRETLRAVGAGLPIDELFFCPEFFLGSNERPLIERARERSGARAVEVSAPVFEKLSYRDRPDGLLAVAPIPSWGLETLDARIAARAASRTGETSAVPLVLVVQAIEKPGNLGTMLRTADAAGVTAAIVCDEATDLWNPNVVRASVGTLFTVPAAAGESPAVRDWLRERRIRLVATSPDAERLHSEADLSLPTALVIGSEQYGLDAEWLAGCDERVRIPMRGEADSLNAAISAAVVLFEALRQRG
jgi:TrmH family RNA methyltransferase